MVKESIKRVKKTFKLIRMIITLFLMILYIKYFSRIKIGLRKYKLRLNAPTIAPTVSGEASGLRNIFNYNMVFYLRTRRFVIMLPLALAISLINLFLVEFHVVLKPANVYTFTEANLGYSTILYILISSIFAGDLISRDFSKEGLFILTQPVSREEIYYAKLLSAITVSSIIVLVYLIGSFISAYLLYFSIVPNWWKIVGLSILAIISLLSFISLFSAAIRNPTVSITISIFVLMIIFPLISTIMQEVNKEPFFLITYALQAIPYLAEKIYPAHVVTQPSLDGRVVVTYNPTLLESVLIMLGYLLLGMVIGLIIYKRRQLADV